MTDQRTAYRASLVATSRCVAMPASRPALVLAYVQRALARVFGWAVWLGWGGQRRGWCVAADRSEAGPETAPASAQRGCSCHQGDELAPAMRAERASQDGRPADTCLSSAADPHQTAAVRKWAGRSCAEPATRSTRSQTRSCRPPPRTRSSGRPRRALLRRTAPDLARG